MRSTHQAHGTGDKLAHIEQDWVNLAAWAMEGGKRFAREQPELTLRLYRDLTAFPAIALGLDDPDVSQILKSALGERRALASHSSHVPLIHLYSRPSRRY
jgi:hypothetical protein